MKNRRATTVLSVFLMLCSLFAAAQTSDQNKIPLNEPDYNKPKLFNDLPEKISFDPANLSHVFQYRVGQVVTFSLAAGFDLTGVVVSTSDDQKALSVVIRATNRQGARLTLTKVTDADNTIRYVGRILSLQHGDSYEIVYENKQYFLKKKGLYDLVNE